MFNSIYSHPEFASLRSKYYNHQANYVDADSGARANVAATSNGNTSVASANTYKAGEYR